MIRIAFGETKQRVLVLGLFGVALILRLWGLTAQAIWVDEVFTLKYSGLGVPMSWERLCINLQGPLQALIVWLVSRPFGWDPLALRLPQALIGAASAPLLYAVARRPFGDRTAVVSGFLLAINPFHVWYSQEIRNYVLAMLFAIVGLGAIRSFADRERRGAAARLMALAATWTAGLLANLSFGFHVVAASAWGWLQLRRSPRDLVLLGFALVLTGAALFPWLHGFYERRVARSNALSLAPIPQEELLRGGATAPLSGLPYAAFAFSAGYSLGPSLSELRRSPSVAALRGHEVAIGATATCFGFLALSGLVRWFRGGTDRRLWLLCLLLPPLLAFLLATRNIKVFNPRYAAVALPVYMVLLADGLWSARWRRLAAACFAGVVALSLLSNIQLHTQRRYWKEDGGAAAAILKERVHPGDLVLVIGGWDPIDHYYWREQRGDRSFQRFFAPYRTPPGGEGAEEPGGKALAAVEAANTTYVLFFRDDFVDPSGAWERFVKDRFAIDASWSFTGGRVWKLGERKP